MKYIQNSKSYALRRHFIESMRWQSHPAPWPRMILCAAATCLPLVIGLCRGELVISIYGALTGYILGLSDHLGPLKHRLWTITLTFLLLITGFTVGRFLQGNQLEFLVLFGVLVYWLGILAGEGAELEKALLFTTIALVSAHSTQQVPAAALPVLWLYVCVAYASLMVGMPLLRWVNKRPPEPITGFKNALKKTWTLHREKHLHAASYMLTALLSLGVAQYFQLERANWVTVTVLLVMKPDQNPIFYRAFQRFAGTILAVLCVDLLLEIIHDLYWTIPLIIACALGVPWAIKKNYWMVTFLATIMVVLLLELVSPHPGDLHTPFVRLVATLLGCVLGLIGLGVAKALGQTSYFMEKQQVSR